MLRKLVARKMAAKEVEQLIQEVILPLRKLKGLEKIILFGSSLEEDFTEASDLDFLLVFENKDLATAAGREIYGLHSGKWPCDFLCYDRTSYEEKSKVGGVCFVAKHEGRTLFSKERSSGTIPKKV
ncbi:MAG: nucleotidyltransferase domain-containing protein [Deltaproteobacteria bacterium]|nr:nucleotidyltransferase domain-containing protein [Deltaproteobacteria bacterium]